MKKKLYKSRDNKIIDGVCGGIAEYINEDPTIVRIVFAVVSLLSSAIPGILLYIILAIVMPRKDETI